MAPASSLPPGTTTGGPTLSTRSADPSSPEPPDPTGRPASRYAASGNPAGRPAPAPPATSYPAWISFLADSGTSATRRSPGAVSLGTPMRIGTPLQDGNVQTYPRRPVRPGCLGGVPRARSSAA